MSFTMVTVTGTFQNPDGTPASGMIRFTPTAAMCSGTRTVNSAVTAPVNGGVMVATIVATDDTGTLPVGVTYMVEEFIGGTSKNLYWIAVPHTSSTLNLCDVARLSPAPPVVQYELVSNKGQPGGYAALDSGGKVPTSQLPASSGAVASVNGHTGTVVLAAADVGADPAGELGAVVVSGTPTAGQVPIASSGSAAAWGTPPTAPVTSVNTHTGTVVLAAADVGADAAGHVGAVAVTGTPTAGQVPIASSGSAAAWGTPPTAPVTSVNTHTGTVVLNNTDVGADAAGHVGAVAVTGTPTAGQVPIASSGSAAAWGTPPTAPVASVNGHTGTVVLAAADVGADAFGSVGAVAVTGTAAAGKALVATDANDAAWQENITGPGIFNVMAYGAKPDGLYALDAVMTAGSPNVTCASTPFGTAVPGQLVMVHGAGITGATTLCSTILTVTDSGHLVLADNAANSVSGARIMWGTENSAAFTACVNAAVAWARAHSYAATVYVPGATGRFYAFGAYTTGGITLGNAHVPLPIIPTTESKVTLRIKGVAFGASTQHWEQLEPTFVGSTLVSFHTYPNPTAQNNDITANGNPAMFGGPTQPHTYGQSGKYSNMTVVLDSLSILTAHSSFGLTGGAADFSGLAGYGLVDFGYGTTGTVPGGDYVTPANFATGLSIGVLGSANGNNDQCYLSNVTCHGGYTYGFFATEHTVCARLCMLYCWSGLVVVGTYYGSEGATHAMWFGQVSTEGCTNVLYVEGVGSAGIGPFVHIEQLDTENGQPNFADNTSGNGLAALLGEVNLTGLYTPDNITVPFPTGLRIRNSQSAFPVRTVTTNYTVRVHDEVILADATSATLAVTLVSAAWTPNSYTVKKTDSSTHPVVVTAAAGQSIDGQPTFALTVPGQAVKLIPVGGSGTTWKVVSGGATTADLAGAVPVAAHVNTVAASGAAQTLPAPTTATLNEVTLTANCTLTFPAATAGWSFTLVLRQDATGSRTVTWPVGTKWPGGAAPTLATAASSADVLSFVCSSAGVGWMGMMLGHDVR